MPCFGRVNLGLSMQGLRLPRLESLSASRNNLASIGDACGCGALEELDLSDNPLTSLSAVHGCSRLQRLRVDDCGVTDSLLAQVGHLPALAELSLSGNRISRAGLATLTRISTCLVTLNLARNDLCDDADDGEATSRAERASTLNSTSKTRPGAWRLGSKRSASQGLAAAGRLQDPVERILEPLSRLPLLSDLSLRGNPFVGRWRRGIDGDEDEARMLAPALRAGGLASLEDVVAEEGPFERVESIVRLLPSLAVLDEVQVRVFPRPLTDEAGGPANSGATETAPSAASEQPGASIASAQELVDGLDFEMLTTADAAAVIGAHISAAAKLTNTGESEDVEVGGSPTSRLALLEMPSYGKILRPMESVSSLLVRGADFKASLARLRADTKQSISEARAVMDQRLGSASRESGDESPVTAGHAASPSAGFGRPVVPSQDAAQDLEMSLPTTRSAWGEETSRQPVSSAGGSPCIAAARERRQGTGSLMSLLQGDGDPDAALEDVRRRAREAVERASRLAGIHSPPDTVRPPSDSRASPGLSSAKPVGPVSKYLQAAACVARAQLESASLSLSGAGASGDAPHNRPRSARVPPRAGAALHHPPPRPSTAAARAGPSRLSSALRYSRTSEPDAADGSGDTEPEPGAGNPVLRLRERPSTAGLQRASMRQAGELDGAPSQEDALASLGGAQRGSTPPRHASTPLRRALDQRRPAQTRADGTEPHVSSTSKLSSPLGRRSPSPLEAPSVPRATSAATASAPSPQIRHRSPVRAVHSSLCTTVPPGSNDVPENTTSARAMVRGGGTGSTSIRPSVDAAGSSVIASRRGGGGAKASTHTLSGPSASFSGSEDAGRDGLFVWDRVTAPNVRLAGGGAVRVSGGKGKRSWGIGTDADVPKMSVGAARAFRQATAASDAPIVPTTSGPTQALPSATPSGPPAAALLSFAPIDLSRVTASGATESRPGSSRIRPDSARSRAAIDATLRGRPVSKQGERGSLRSSVSLIPSGDGLANPLRLRGSARSGALSRSSAKHGATLSRFRKPVTT